MVVLRIERVVFKSGCMISGKLVETRGCIRAKLLYSGKSGCIWAKVVVFGQS